MDEKEGARADSKSMNQQQEREDTRYDEGVVVGTGEGIGWCPRSMSRR